MVEVERLITLGSLPLCARGEVLVQCGNWPVPFISQKTYPHKEYWAMFLGYKRGRPLGLAEESLKCQFVHWLGEGGTEYAVFRPISHEENCASVHDTSCPT